MRQKPVKYSFTPIMKITLVAVTLCGIMGKCFAQDKQVEGIVYDNISKERIAKVNIQNARTHQSVYNSLQAEFKLTARADDQLIINKTGYFPDTVKVGSGNTVLVYLKPTSIQLRQVNIKDTLLSPQKRYLATRQEYSKAYGSDAYRDILSVSPGSGAGISIDAIWNSFSKEGRNAQKLQDVIERDYHENIIDYRFNKTLVASITGAKEPQLTDFMQKYRPDYYAVTNDSQYDFVNTIRMNYRRYLRNSRIFSLAPLK